MSERELKEKREAESEVWYVDFSGTRFYGRPYLSRPAEPKPNKQFIYGESFNAYKLEV